MLLIHRTRFARHLRRTQRRQSQPFARQDVFAEIAVARGEAGQAPLGTKANRHARGFGHGLTGELDHFPGLALQQRRRVATAALEHPVLPAHFHPVRVRHAAHAVLAVAVEHQHAERPTGGHRLVAAQALAVDDEGAGREHVRIALIEQQRQPVSAHIQPPGRFIAHRAEQRLLHRQAALGLRRAVQFKHRRITLDPDPGAIVIDRHHPRTRRSALGPQRPAPPLHRKCGQFSEVAQRHRPLATAEAHRHLRVKQCDGSTLRSPLHGRARRAEKAAARESGGGEQDKRLAKQCGHGSAPETVDGSGF